MRWFPTLLLAASISTPLAGAEPGRVFVVVDQEGQLAIEERALVEGEELTLQCDKESGVVAVVLPVAPGGSASVEKRGDARVFRIHQQEGSLSLAVDLPDGRVWRHPGARLAELAGYDIHVSVTAGDGKRKAFRIEEYARVVEDEVAPVVDLFSGKIPLGPEDYVLFTDTRCRAGVGASPAKGGAAVDVDRWAFLDAELSSGERGVFLLDTGAGSTIVSRSFLPKDVELHEAGMAQYTADGREFLRYAAEGATGVVEGVVGAATVDLQVGDIRFDELDVVVLGAMPDIFGRPVAGILGLDALQRAPRVSFRLGSEGRLELGVGVRDDAEGLEVPFSIVRSHIVLRANLNELPACWILDTGAPGCVIDVEAAEATGLHVHESVRAGGGLDGGRVALSPTEATIDLGGKRFDQVPAMVGDLPIFRTLRGKDQHVALLGCAFLARFREVQIDFESHTMRFFSE